MRSCLPVSLGLLFCAVACASGTVVESGSDCTEFRESFDSARQLTRARENARVTAGATASVAAAGATALTETVLYLGGGVALGVVICSPVILIEVAADGSGHASGECVTEVGSAATRVIAREGDYEYTRAVWEGMEPYRIRSMDDLSELVRRNAGCLAARGQADDFALARRQLAEIRGDQGIWPYLSEAERARVSELEARLAPSPVLPDSIE
ncbi:MAG: hypothetical protein H7A21_14570 [Spirochaetales bacterium]|nr:hypothetical protein [Leptospiraceae bacterium]MCP5482657.1 hypothetical protein [Spirochaetales bacterium]MCP5485039.1 hypothetical protein [Spirochaetales bacterium]